jgi:hypothetical protein
MLAREWNMPMRGAPDSGERRVRPRLPWCLAVAMALCITLDTDRCDAAEVSFRRDVMAVLAKAGCNQGTCHGNQNGKGGFKLSLRGQDPELDFAALTSALFGRRIDRLQPERSLILEKPSLQVPHEGGMRFRPDREEYRILRDWIASGAGDDVATAPRLERLTVTPREQILVEPLEEFQLSVTAHFADGSTRDVTRLAVYEPAAQVARVSHDGLVTREAIGETTVLVRYLQRQVPVRVAFVPARPDFVWSDPPQQNFIDCRVFAKLRDLRINPSELASDSEFLRRAYLDTLGLLPTADEAKAFVADTRPDKRARLIDALLARPEFAEHWALKWSDLLRNEEKVLDRKGVQNFHAWIRTSIAEGKPLDQFVRELVAARGSTYTNPPANYYRANRDAVTRAEATAQLFLGVRLQCCKCHNHPFDRWTQDDYYRWAGLFAKVYYKILENNRRDKNDKHEFDGEQIVYLAEKGHVDNPRTGEPAQPKFLGAATPKFTADDDPLAAVANWLTEPDHPLFAQVQVNRIWYQLMGRGIVDPIDDFRSTNPASNPALLEALTADFVAHRFDLRHAIRTIMNSRTYQLSSEPNDTNRDDEVNFSRASVRRLSAEQLLDAFSQVADVPIEFGGYPPGTRAGQLPGGAAIRRRGSQFAAGDQFLTLFGKPPRLLTCECERTTDTTLGQAVNLISGQALNELLTHEDNRLTRLLASDLSNPEIVTELYWTALSRAPNDEELAATTSYLASSADRRAALEDVLWSLVNAKEFLLRN